MSSSVIRARGVGKMYRIRHHSRDRYTALRDVIARRASSLVARREADEMASEESFWALDGVSFDVARGETLGIVGRNGAGKSTLLKLLSRVSEPTTGRIELRGRVASLLEVGTGFHPELSGRENVYLNAAILGMRRAEIRRKFDEIVAFAEVDQFLDTPVKRYSSGMYVRLAFAVAAHLEPDILIVDEVLAVGDFAFQAKCLGKMNQVSRDGRTVLLVSHDMRAITALCRRAILLDAGRVECEGPAADVAAFYQMGRDEGATDIDLTSRTDRSGSGDARVESIALRRAGTASRIAVVGEPFELSIGVRVTRYVGTAVLHVNILTPEGVAVYEFYSNDDGASWPGSIGRYRFGIAIDRLALYPGIYTVNVWIGDRASHRVDYVVNAMSFEVTQTPDSGVARPLERAHGLVVERAQWTCVMESA